MHSNSNTSVSSGSSRGRSGGRAKRAIIPIKKAQKSEVSDSNGEIKQREFDSAKGEDQLSKNEDELMESTKAQNAIETPHQNLQRTSNPTLEEGKDTVSDKAEKNDQVTSDIAEDAGIIAVASDTVPAQNVIPDESVGLSQSKDEHEVADNRTVDTNEVAVQENLESEIESKDDLSNMPEAEPKMNQKTSKPDEQQNVLDSEEAPQSLSTSQPEEIVSTDIKVSTKDLSEEDKLNDSKPVEKVSNDGESVKQTDFENSECQKTSEIDNISAISDSGDDMSPEPESSSEVLKKSLNEVDQPRNSGDSQNVAAPKSVVRSNIIDEEDEDIPRCDLCGDPTHQSRNCTIFTKRKMEPEPNRRAPTCYYCKEVGHVKFHCPKIQNQGRRVGRNTNYNDIPTQQPSGWGAPPMPRAYSATNQSENRTNFVHVPMPVLASSIKPEIKLRSQLTARNTSSKENISQIPSTSKPAPSDFGKNYVASTMQFSSNISKEVLATQPPKKKINYIRSDSEDESDEGGEISLELPSISDTNKQQVKVEKSATIPDVQAEKEVPDTPKMMERLTLDDKIKPVAQSNLLVGGPNDNPDDAKPVPSQIQNDKKTVKEDQPCGSDQANTWNSVMMEDDIITDFDSIALEKELEHLKEMRCVAFDSDESSEYEGSVSDTDDYCGAIAVEEFDGSEQTSMPDVTNPEVGKDVQNP
ncbi:hypothetical protein DdX_10336 [Ditylenchus destructor]|uniref:CCHC-type domain-containing protein n=1 Tax=Ditylenchus destructor TaxID=166010 RepID=A0AAD4N4H2_9BILA|nr:hypothetical protein DdX_10336 [Ditylenchus destructor]